MFISAVTFSAFLKECVKRRSLESVKNNPYCSETAAKDAIEAVWNICYNDTRPFDRAPWSASCWESFVSFQTGSMKFKPVGQVSFPWDGLHEVQACRDTLKCCNKIRKFGAEPKHWMYISPNNVTDYSMQLNSFTWHIVTEFTELTIRLGVTD